MKKIALFTVALVATATMASAGIMGTKHDLSKGTTSGGIGKSTTTTQICIFCHTPHNAVQAVPLWNRANPSNSGWTMYYSATLSQTASTKLSSGTTNGSFDASSISLFCLSCHDGTTALGAFTNKADQANDTLGALTTALIPGTKANIGGGTSNLANDHPVGFSYASAASEDGLGNLHAIGTANANLQGGAFFGSNSDMVECASCHKVHDNSFAPFLRITNDSSKLCLACHNK